MAITRVTNFTSGTLAFEDLNSEYNNIVNYINNRLLSNPLTSDLDFADLFTITNLRSFWNILNVDEYSSLSAAEAALPATGGMLFIPPDTTIDISATVTISKDNVWIVGAGPSSTLRRATGTFTASQNAMILFNGRANCGIMNLQLDGQQASNLASTGLCAVRVMGASTNFLFKNNYVRRWGEATEANTSPNDGILVGADEASVPGRVLISGNTFENIRRSPVRVMNCRYSAIRENTIIWDTLSSVGAGVHLETPASGSGRLQHIVIDGNVIQGIGSTLPSQGVVVTQGTGSTTTDCSRIVISNNTINNVAGSGCHIDNAMLVAVNGNTIGEVLQIGTSALGGIHVLDSSYVGVGNNILQAIGSAVSNSLAIGIFITASSNQGFNQIIGNIIRETAHYGIGSLVSGTAILSTSQIMSNIITRYAKTSSSSTSAGILIDTDNTATQAGITIAGNRITLDGTTPAPADVHGVQLSNDGTFSRATVLNNDLVGSTAGTGLKVSISATVTGTDISHNQEN